MLSSMTGFGRSDGESDGLGWTWEIRSVNARGLELRWRLPAGLDGMEPPLRDMLGAVVRRGHVQATLSIRSQLAALPVVNEAALSHVLDLAVQLAARLPGAPVPRVESLLGLPGVMGAKLPGQAVEMPQAHQDALREGFASAVDSLASSRRAEGARLGEVLRGMVGQILLLRRSAEEAAAQQAGQQWDRMVANVAALAAAVPGLPEERIAQEVALLAARADVREELDRLASHADAITDKLSAGGAVGRQLDFLVQELVRETNTICSKSAGRELTAIGLQLKAVVEQMREQVQNLE